MWLTLLPWRWDLLENKLPGPLLEKLASQWLDPMIFS